MTEATCPVRDRNGECDRPVFCKGMCSLHYNRKFRTGTTEPRYVPTPEERFWEKVDKTATCWLWTGAKILGYGRFAGGEGKVEQAHRWSYEHFVGPIPEGLQLDHLCRNPSCVNPAHLEPVTGRVNVLRGNTFAAAQAARTHCPAGHEYDEANTYTDAKNHRHCRKCRAATERRRRAAKKDAA